MNVVASTQLGASGLEGLYGGGGVPLSYLEVWIYTTDLFSHHALLKFGMLLE